MKILPIVLHMGHMPVVTFFGPVLIIFWVFRRPIIAENIQKRLLNLDLMPEQYKLKNLEFKSQFLSVLFCYKQELI